MEGRAAILGAMWALDLLFTGVNTALSAACGVAEKGLALCWIRQGLLLCLVLFLF